MFNNQIVLKKPLFMQSETEDKITGAERGSMVHLIMDLSFMKVQETRKKRYIL